MKWIPDIQDVLFFSGIVLFCLGLWMAYRPAAFIGGGAILISLAVIPLRRKQ